MPCTIMGLDTSQDDDNPPTITGHPFSEITNKQMHNVNGLSASVSLVSNVGRWAVFMAEANKTSQAKGSFSNDRAVISEILIEFIVVVI